MSVDFLFQDKGIYASIRVKGNKDLEKRIEGGWIFFSQICLSLNVPQLVPVVTLTNLKHVVLSTPSGNAQTPCVAHRMNETVCHSFSQLQISGQRKKSCMQSIELSKCHS